VTWGNGASGVSGVVSSTNSLVGSTTGDRVGDSGITELSNGNFVVSSRRWDNGTALDAGAVTWGSGTSGVSGVVSSTNSLVGSVIGDSVGSGGVTALSNGNYVVSSPDWDNGTISNAGAATWGSGVAGATDVINVGTSVIGQVENASLDIIVDNTLNSNNVAVRFKDGDVTGTGRIALMLGNSADLSTTFLQQASETVTVTSLFIENTLNNGTDVTLQANSDVIINSEILVDNTGGDGGKLTLQAGRSVLINANITSDNGDLIIVANETLANGVVDVHRLAGLAVVTMGSGTVIDTGTGKVDIQLAEGTGVTEQGSGDITLYEINADTILVLNKGPDAGDIIIEDKTLTANGTGNSLILASVSGGNFINNSGANSLAAPNGRWLVYSKDPALNTLGVLVADKKRYNTTYSTIPGNFGASDDGLLYSIAPVLNITADDISRPFGDPNPPLTFTHTGLIDGDAIGDAVSGSLVTTAIVSSNVGDYPITQGSIVDLLGYTINFVEGTLTIGQRALTITADTGQVKIFGTQDPVFTSAITNGSLLGGDSLIGALGRNPGEAPGPYAINLGTLNVNDGKGGANYIISFVGANFFIVMDPTILGVLAFSSPDGLPQFSTPDNSANGQFFIGPAGGNPMWYSWYNLGWGGPYGWSSPWSPIPYDLINMDF
jgi:hypothetical protein